MLLRRSPALLSMGSMHRRRALRDVQPDELILFSSHRHFLILLRAALPALALALALSALVAGLQVLGVQLAVPVLGSVGGVVVLWLMWLWADWRADLFVLTDRRVLWLERTPFLRETRWEAPLSGIQNVAGISRGPVWRLLGCADLVLDTASRGVQRLHGMRNAQDVASRVIEAQGYSARRTNRIRRFRIEMGAEPDPSGISSPETPEMLVWRRHYWILLRSAFRPLALLTVALGATTLLREPLVLAVMGGVAVLWIGWLVDDWRNDEMVSTADRIVQSRRSPLSLHEETWQAPLEKVQDISYSIPSPLAQLLDFGTITVSTAGGGPELGLSGLPHPREISAELNRRLQLRRSRKERALMHEVEDTVRSVLHAHGLAEK